MTLKEIKPKKGWSAFVLDERSRELLSKHFPPKYSKFVGHHITYKFGVPETDPIPVDVKPEVIGYADSGDGLEALVVALDGQTKRSDGSTFHITWSHDPNYAAKDSNQLVQKGYQKIAPIAIDAEGQFSPFS